MLVLSRKELESIVVGNGKERIEITVVGIKSGRVRLGVKAPPEIVIAREELARDWKPRTKGGTIHGR